MGGAARRAISLRTPAAPTQSPLRQSLGQAGRRGCKQDFPLDFWRKSGFLHAPASVWYLPFSLPSSRGKGSAPTTVRLGLLLQKFFGWKLWKRPLGEEGAGEE